MPDKDHVTYFASKFQSIQSRLPSWSDRNLRNAFLTALAPRIHTQFVSTGRVPPNGLDALIIAAEELDRAYWTDFEASQNIRQLKEKEGERIRPSAEVRPSTNDNRRKKRRHANIPTSSTIPATSTLTDTRPKSNPQNTVEPTYKKHLGPDGKLLPKEHERCLANRLCMLCGQKGHMAADCLKRKQGTAKASLAKATVTILAPTSEVKSKKL
jgi:hypothetical protein